VRPRLESVFVFRHVLVQEAVYRSAPKRLRAELHERYADRLEVESPDLPELDEFVGYHLEQAYRLRAQLGESDRRTDQLAEDAGRRLGAAGLRALKRGDMNATVSLLDRAIVVLPMEDEGRHELMCELGIAQHAMGDAGSGDATFHRAIADAERAGLRRVELRARLEAAYARLLAEPEGSARALLTIAEGAVPTFEALRDDRSLARAWLLIGYVHGGIHGDHAAWEEAEERALGYYRATAFPPATCMQQIAAAIYWGPTAVRRGIDRCTSMLVGDAVGVFGRASIVPYLGGLNAQAGEIARAREFLDEADATFADFGAVATAVVVCGTVRADVELLAGDLDAAEATLREQCEHFERVHDRAHLAVRAAKLAEVLYRQGRLDECENWLVVAGSSAASDDQSAQLIIGAVKAKLLAIRGEIAEARSLAGATVRLADGTDGLNMLAFARLALAEVLGAAGLVEEARQAITEAIDLFKRKGNSVALAQARDLLALKVIV